jgi:hypothetical protein
MASDFFQRSQAEKLPTKIDQDGVIRVFDPGTGHLRRVQSRRNDADILQAK